MKILKNLEIYKKLAYSYIISYSPKVIQSIVVFIIIYFIAKYIHYKLININYKEDGKIDTKTKNKILMDIFANFLYYSLLVIGLFTSLVILGINVNSILVLFGSIGFAIALSLKDTLSNASSGIMILLLDYFDLENLVDINGTMGTINKFNLFTTTLRGSGGVLITYPNTTITNGIIKNYNKSEDIRITINFLISNYDKTVPIDEIISKIRDGIISKSSYLIDKEKLIIGVGKMEENSTTFFVKIPIKSVNFKIAMAESNLIIKNIIMSINPIFSSSQSISFV